MTESTSQKLELRLLRMRERDLREVLVVERSAYSFPWSERVFQDCLRVGYSCWLARACGDDGRGLRGFAVMSIGAGEAHVLNLCVDADWHRRGVGQRLLTHLRLVARNHQVSRMLLEVRPSNGGAIALYERAGFARIGERRGYYPSDSGREDAIVMALDVDEPGAGRSTIR